MLNPFAIEKDLFTKTAALSVLLRNLKGTVAESVVGSRQQGKKFSSVFVIECIEICESLESSNRLYVCKVCGKEFDEGRKLGGHVSRAHKGNDSSMSFLEESSSEAYHPRGGRRTRVKVEEMELEEQETGYKRVKFLDPIYQEL